MMLDLTKVHQVIADYDRQLNSFQLPTQKQRQLWRSAMLIRLLGKRLNNGQCASAVDDIDRFSMHFVELTGQPLCHKMQKPGSVPIYQLSLEPIE